MITVSIEIPVPLLEAIKNFIDKKPCQACDANKDCSLDQSYCSYVLEQINSYLGEGEVDDAN